MAKPPGTRAQQASSEQGRTRARHYSAHGAADSRRDADRPIDGTDQSNFFLGKTETSGREGILIWCADRLQAVKWRNYKVHFYQQETMISSPVKLPVPFLFNLYMICRKTRASRRSTPGLSDRY